MVVEVELIRERIETLQEYIRLLEKVRGVLIGFGLSANAKAVFEIIDRKIGWPTQLMAGAAGFLMFLVCLGFGRIFMRSPALLVLVFAAAGILSIYVAVLVFSTARRRIADHEMNRAQLEIYRLESQLNK
jgi:hypothetical protein